MKRLGVLVALCVLLSASTQFCSVAYAKQVWVSTDGMLEAALEDENVTDIVITQDIVGNFEIPHWLRSLKGASSNITIIGADQSEYVLDIEFEMFGHEPLSISDLTIQGNKGLEATSKFADCSIDNVWTTVKPVDTKCNINI